MARYLITTKPLPELMLTSVSLDLTPKPEQNGRNSSDEIFHWLYFVDRKPVYFLSNSLKNDAEYPTDDKSGMVQLMACRLFGDWVQWRVTKPRRVNSLRSRDDYASVN